MSRPLPGTEGAKYPCWSPDSRAAAFFAEDKLKRLDIDTGSVETLSYAGVGDGCSWNRNDVILFSRAPQDRFFRIPATGGEPVVLSPLVDQPGMHRFPHFLPDGEHFLYYVLANLEATGIYVGEVNGPRHRLLLNADSAAVYLSSGHLLFVRKGTLFAEKFDPGRLQLMGNPIAVAENVSAGQREGSVALSAATNGIIAYRGGTAAQNRLEWVDRSGKLISVLPVNGGAPAISPDGRFVALQTFLDGNMDIWFADIDRGSVTRFTSDPRDDAHPAWSPDGKYIVFASSRKGMGHWDLYRKPTTGSLGTERVLLESPEYKLRPHVSPDGRFVLYNSMDPKTMKYDIWAVRLDSNQKPFLVVGTQYDDRHAQFSPDGKWIAYESDESGRFEIYIQPFPGATSRFGPISTNGGAQAQWRGDGKELYYLGLDNRLMAVPIRLSSNGGTADFGSPVPLFMTRIFGGAVQANLQYTVSRDGQRFLVHNIAEETASPITVVLNLKLKP